MNSDIPNLHILIMPCAEGSQLFEELNALIGFPRRLNVFLPGPDANVEELVSRYEINAGFLILPAELDTAEVDRLQYQLSRTSQVEWIALLEPGALANPKVVQVVSHYCCDFIHMPWQLNDLHNSLSTAVQVLRSKCSKAHRRLVERPLTGLSQTMYRVSQSLFRMAPVDAPVLITGESGTGKELAARAIHYYSLRSDRPFVPVDCGALPEGLVHSKLFGHEKGAFTGALENRQGVLELADGGTVFLDKIENLPLTQQVSLLRFLQESTIDPVGSLRPRKVNVRVIAAAHENLEDKVQSGQLREDLYYRLNVLNIQMPPLRARDKDIELLAWHYLHQFRKGGQKRPTGFTPEALATLRSYNWPGNVRELVNRIRRAAVMCESDLIRVEDLGFDVGSSKGDLPIMTLTEARAKAEREVVLQSLQCTGYNISASARLLNISRLSLYRMMDKYSLMRDEASERVSI